jgi:hypothetical protein
MISAASRPSEDSSENPTVMWTQYPALAALSAWWHHAGKGRASQELPSEHV